MAFGYRRPDSPAWWVRYKGVADPVTGKRKYVAEACPPQVTTKEIADEYAAMRELQAKIEVGVREVPPSGGIQTLIASTQVTIKEAARRHPATRREEQTCPRDARRHLKDLQNFSKATGAVLLSQMTLDVVLDYLESMRRQRLGYHTRRHALSWLKRASAMAPSYGMFDVLSGMKLDRNESSSVKVEAYDLAEIAARLDEALALDDRRVAAVIALGVTCGLRPTEICRLKIGDIDVDALTLQVGSGIAKNAASVRLLPISRHVLRIIEPLLDRDSISPVFTNGKVGTRHIDIYKLAHLITPHLGAPPKILRKSFSTIAALELGVDERVVEGMLGHALSGFAQVTRKHYLARSRVERLKPVVDAFERGFLQVAEAKKLPRLVTEFGPSVLNA